MDNPLHSLPQPEIDYGDLQEDIDQGAIPLLVHPEGLALFCPNCGGARSVYVFILKTGPWQWPQGTGSKWLTYQGKEGWYEGKIRAAFCPKCVDPFKMLLKEPPKDLEVERWDLKD